MIIDILSRDEFEPYIRSSYSDNSDEHMLNHVRRGPPSHPSDLEFFKALHSDMRAGKTYLFTYNTHTSRLPGAIGRALNKKLGTTETTVLVVKLEDMNSLQGYNYKLLYNTSSKLPTVSKFPWERGQHDRELRYEGEAKSDVTFDSAFAAGQQQTSFGLDFG